LPIAVDGSLVVTLVPCLYVGQLVSREMLDGAGKAGLGTTPLQPRQVLPHRRRLPGCRTGCRPYLTVTGLSGLARPYLITRYTPSLVHLKWWFYSPHPPLSTATMHLPCCASNDEDEEFADGRRGARALLRLDTERIWAGVTNHGTRLPARRYRRSCAATDYDG
jgi:hypothetical protein